MNAPEAQQDRRELFLGNLLTARWRPYRTGEFELKVGHLANNLDVVPSSGSKERPRFHDIETGAFSGNAESYDYDDRTRIGASLDYTQRLDDTGGDHRIKGGVAFWRTTNGRDVQHTANVPGFDGVVYETAPGAGMPCDTDLDSDGVYDNCAGLEGRYDVGRVGNATRLYTAFLQDDWAPLDALTFNLGFRLDVEEARNNEGDEVFTQFQPAPRTGLAWDVTGDGKTLVSAHYGRYFDIHGSQLSSWANTLSPTGFRGLGYSPALDPPSDPRDPIYEDGTYPYFPYYAADHVSDLEMAPLTFCTDDSLDSYTSILVGDWGVFETMEEAREYVDDLDERYCDGRLVPYHMDKLALGMEREIMPNLSFGVRAIWSQTRDLPEDIDVDLDSWIVSSRVGKRRDYRALELTATKEYDGRWGALASWTLSESKGHMPGQFERPSGGQVGGGGNGVGLYLDSIDDPDARTMFHEWGAFLSDPYTDPELIEETGHMVYHTYPSAFEGMGTLTDDQGYYGYLPYHSFHQAKINGFYTFPFGTTIGLVYEFDSGHAWEKKGFQRAYRDYHAMPEGRGSRFMPSVHYIDLRLAQTIEFNDMQDLEISLDIFNVPGLETPVTYYANDVEGLFGKTFFRQAPRSMRLGVKYTF
ncbi:MAG: TonB-dependent receptor [Deltaproteobacteria bacterium]|nr:TonB-dependent receptor [Deltaproteobacteria bacterium]